MNAFHAQILRIAEQTMNAMEQQRKNKAKADELIKQYEQQNGLIIDVDCRIIEEPKQLENK